MKSLLLIEIALTFSAQKKISSFYLVCKGKKKTEQELQQAKANETGNPHEMSKK